MPVVVYSVLRLLLFVVALVALYLAGLRDWLLVLVAALVALMLSYLTLRRPREAASRWLAERAERRARTGERFSRRIEEDAAIEDAAVDGGTSATASGPDTAPADTAPAETAQAQGTSAETAPAEAAPTERPGPAGAR